MKRWGDSELERLGEETSGISRLLSHTRIFAARVSDVFICASHKIPYACLSWISDHYRLDEEAYACAYVEESPRRICSINLSE